MTDNENAVLVEIQHYLDIGHYDQAMARVTCLLEENPENGYLLSVLATCLCNLDLYDDALAACRDALNYGFSEEDGNLLLGQIYFELRRYIESEEAFLTALGINPANAEALAAYSYLLLAAGYEQKSSELMAEALRLDHENELVSHYNLLSLILTGKGNKQLPALMQFIKSSDNEVNKLINMGIYEWARKDYKSARESFRQAFLLEPTNQNILAILKEFDRTIHWLFWPSRLFNRFFDFDLAMGGLWSMISIGVWMDEAGYGEGLSIAGATILIFGISLGIYTLLASALYGLFGVLKSYIPGR